MAYSWIDQCLALPKEAREQPINVAHLKLLLLIARFPDIKTDSLLPYFENEKPTLISRINFLTRKQLILKLPAFNTGGNAKPNYYRVTKKGETIAASMGQML